VEDGQILAQHLPDAGGEAERRYIPSGELQVQKYWLEQKWMSGPTYLKQDTRINIVARLLGGSSIVLGAAWALLISGVFLLTGIMTGAYVYNLFATHQVSPIIGIGFLGLEILIGLTLLTLIIGFVELLCNIQPLIAGLFKLKEGITMRGVA
jgi:hypothetical protein